MDAETQVPVNSESTETETVAHPVASSVEFVQEFTKAQRRVFLYILSLIPHPADAEEILQDANLIIWSKATQFRPGTSFIAWACQIAYYEVLKFRDRKRRDKLQFSEEFLEAVAAEAEQHSEQVDLRRKVLSECLGKLRRDDRELVQLRYGPEGSGEQVASRLGRPVNSIYQSLGRIRRALWDCMTRRLTAEGRS